MGTSSSIHRLLPGAGYDSGADNNEGAQLTDDRYDYLMDMWVQHMHSGSLVDGYASRASVCLTLAGPDFNEMADAAEADVGAAVDACVEDMRTESHNHYLALHCKYLAGVWRFPRLDRLVVTNEAQDMLKIILMRRGLDA